MATLGSRDFQIGYQKLTEVTRVEARGKYLGTWYPAGQELQGLTGAVAEGAMVLLEKSETDYQSATQVIESLEAEVKQLKRQLAAQALPGKIADPSFGRSYPAPKTGKK